MKNFKIPQQKIQPVYRFKSGSQSFADTTTTVTSQGDPTNSCTTVVTTTHFAPKEV